MKSKPAHASYAFLAACCIVGMIGSPQWLWLWPFESPHFGPWQLVTYAFVHANFIHLIVNVIATISFAPYIERKWGSWHMLFFMLAATIGAGFIQICSSGRPVVGASGLLFGVFAAYAWTCPNKRIATLFGWKVKAWIAISVYFVASIAAWIFDVAPGVAHMAHAGGALIGLAAAIGFRR